MKFIRSLYISKLFFTLIGVNVGIFVFSFFFPFLLIPARLFLIILSGLLIIDILLLFSGRKRISAERQVAQRLSNGDDNEVVLKIQNKYPFKIRANVIDELPFQLQIRDLSLDINIASEKTEVIEYKIRPFARGEYHFGCLNVFVSGLLKLAERRFKFPLPFTSEVYPSFLQMKKYELMAIHNRFRDPGLKKLRRLGHNMEFEQIKEYVQGDDIRTVNHNATARAASLMVNQYQDEKSQSVYCIIDKGRSMKMPFENMSLLDYAINASLAISNVVIKKDDKAGLLIFDNNIGGILGADRKKGQVTKVLQMLYNVETNYNEPDYSRLYAYITRKVNQRSLLVIFSNFETLSSLRRQMPYLRKLALHHLIVVVLFENTELKEVTEKQVAGLEEIYVKTIARKFAFEKKLIIKELNAYGILSVLTAPKELTVNVLNKYLEVKSRNMI